MAFEINRDQKPEERIADALEFIAHRLSGIEYGLFMLHAQLKDRASQEWMDQAMGS